MPGAQRPARETRSDVVLFRMKPSKRKGLVRLADAYEISEAETIRRLLEPAIDEELALLQERTSMKAAGLRERTRAAKLALKGRHQPGLPSRLRTG